MITALHFLSCHIPSKAKLTPQKALLFVIFFIFYYGIYYALQTCFFQIYTLLYYFIANFLLIFIVGIWRKKNLIYNPQNEMFAERKTK